MKKIVENLAEISSPEGLRVGLWILGEYASAPDPAVRVGGGVCVVCVIQYVLCIVYVYTHGICVSYI